MSLESPSRFEFVENTRPVAEKVTDYIDEQVGSEVTIRGIVELLTKAKGVAEVDGLKEPAFIDREVDAVMYFPDDIAADVWSYYEFKKAQTQEESVGYEDGGAALPQSVRERIVELTESGHQEQRH